VLGSPHFKIDFAAESTVNNSAFDGSLQLYTEGGGVALKEFFADKQYLIVVHNMGIGCNYCAAYADGISGVAHHLNTAASLLLVSPTPIETLQPFAKSRGWAFPVACDRDQEFTRASGYLRDPEGYWPGISTFRLDGDGAVHRSMTRELDPGDDLCVIWPILKLFGDEFANWEPRSTARQSQ
jgi:predicted dithiol-disulfide oxidoreductase (DUF899 family)